MCSQKSDNSQFWSRVMSSSHSCAVFTWETHMYDNNKSGINTWINLRTWHHHAAHLCLSVHECVRVQLQGPAAPGLRARRVLGPGRLGRVDQRGLGPSGAAPQRGPTDARALEHHGKPSHCHLCCVSIKHAHDSWASVAEHVINNRNADYTVFFHTNISHLQKNCSIKFLSTVFALACLY